MAKETTFNEDFHFICECIDKYSEVLMNEDTMKSSLGGVIKNVITGNYVFRRLIENNDNKKRMIKLLVVKYEKETILNILHNLEIEI